MIGKILRIFLKVVGSLVLLWLCLLFSVIFLQPIFQPACSEEPLLLWRVEKNAAASDKFLADLNQHFAELGLARSYGPFWMGAYDTPKLNQTNGESYWFNTDRFKGDEHYPCVYYLRVVRYPAPEYAIRISTVVRTEPKWGTFRPLNVLGVPASSALENWAKSHGATASERIGFFQWQH